jgi:hypothetical protein
MTTAHDEMPISETQLTALTHDLDGAHHDTLPAMHHAVAELTEKLHDVASGHPVDRRAFLVTSGLLGGGVVLAACSSSGSSTAKSTTTAGAAPTTAASGSAADDLKVAALAAALENLAVKTYQAAIDAVGAGKLGTVPPAVATFAKTVMGQHADHAAAWNTVLTGAGKAKVTGVDITVDDAVVKPGFAKVTSVPELAKFALSLENVAAATYLNGIQNALSQTSAIKLAATIQPVEMQHASILSLLLGQYPVPDKFAQTKGARTLSDKIG